jgi:hypothetical protein
MIMPDNEPSRACRLLYVHRGPKRPQLFDVVYPAEVLEAVLY